MTTAKTAKALKRNQTIWLLRGAAHMAENYHLRFGLDVKAFIASVDRKLEELGAETHTARRAR